jgi:hypothetical protein
VPALARHRRVPAGAVRGFGLLGLLGVLAGVFFVVAGAATRPSVYVPARHGGWPHWMAGPLEGLGVGISGTSFQVWVLVMCASYLAVLLAVRALPSGVLVGAILLAHLILLLGPPLISQDVFGYLSFARMGALHGLDPYTHAATEAPTDPSFAFIGREATTPPTSPYGPLFTLASYALAPLGLAGGLWALKAIAVCSSLGAVALIARAATRLGQSARWATAFVGLNPALLVLAVGSDHIDTLIMLLLALAIAMTAGANPRVRAGAATLAVGVGVKITAGLALPFILLAPSSARERLRAALSAAAGLLAVLAIGLVGFGAHALGFLTAIGEQQQLVAVHSIPAETARLMGLSGTPTWWRHLFLAGFVVVLASSLWRTARGADWRVAAGWTTLALLLSTAWLLPWYAIWLLPLAAVGGDRRLLAATLLFCAYAVLIHLSLADPLLSPTHHRVVTHLHIKIPNIRDRVKFTGFEILRHVQLNLRW